LRAVSGPVIRAIEEGRTAVSVPRLIVAGVEPGPALDLVAGALVAGFGEQRAVRPVLVGLDLPLWRLLYGVSARAPRAIDPRLHPSEVVDELFGHWSDAADLTLLVAARPLLDSWEGIRGSRPADVARRFDAPVVLVLDARERGASAAAAVYGSRALAGELEIAGLVLVGGDGSPGGTELADTLRRSVGIPVLGHVPPQLSEQFMRQYAAGSASSVRTVGARPSRDTLGRLCREASTYLKLDELIAAAARRGFLPSPPRRLLAPASTGGLSVAVAWGPPLQPIALENIDLLQAMGLELLPLNVARDATLPEGCGGLLLLGILDEQEIGAFAANEGLHVALRSAVGAGLPTLAMGGGSVLLMQRLADSRGRTHELAGVIPAEAEMIESYDRPHYLRVEATRNNPFDEGESLVYELFDLEYLVLEQDSFAYQVRVDDGGMRTEGFVVDRCLASTTVSSLAGKPAMAEKFLAAVRAARGA
jgi:cobyrinic acid a,c-diamide synthase